MTKDENRTESNDQDAPSLIFYLHSFFLFSGRILNMVLDLYNRIFDFSPRDRATIYNNISRHYIKKGMYEKALYYLREWTRLDPSNPEAHYRFALTLMESGNRKNALAVLGRVLKLKPGHRGAILHKSTLQLKLKDYKGAVQSLEQAVKATPAKAKLHYLLGIAYEGLDELDHSVRSMERAVALDPDEIRYHQYLGFLNVRRDDHKTAAKSFTRVMELERELEGDDHQL